MHELTGARHRVTASLEEGCRRTGLQSRHQTRQQQSQHKQTRNARAGALMAHRAHYGGEAHQQHTSWSLTQ